MSAQIIVITDLDGTLLDHQTYDYSPARAALEELKRRRIPLVLCSSKTASEMILLREEIKNAHPFIVENGGGIYIPKDYFSILPAGTWNRNSFQVIPLGRAYFELQRILDRLSAKHHLNIEAFHDMSAKKLALASGLPLEQAERSLEREFDLPFRVLRGDGQLDLLEQAAREEGLRLIRGGRFLHLSGLSDKGTAVQSLIELYQVNSDRAVQVIGLGDSQNDAGLLQEVDIPVLIPNPHSQAPLGNEVPDLRRAEAAGPSGWSEIVLELLAEADIEEADS